MKKLSSVTISGGLTVDQATTLSGVVSVGGIGTGAYTSVLVRNSSNQMLHRTYSDFLNDISASLNLSGYVPTSRTLTINGVTFDLTANRSWTISSPSYVSKLQHTVKAGVSLTKGQAVYVTGADGTNMIVGLASNASEATSSKTMGLVDATVSANGFVNIVTEGLLAGLDTSTAGTEGDPVWLGTGGNLIYGLAGKPYAPAHLVFIGIVTRKNNSNGEIFVKVQNGFELKEIHDVDLITTAPINGHLLGYNGTLWVNKTIATWLGYTPANASGTTNYISKFTGSTTLGNSQIFDNGTNVGIGTASPAFKLDINGVTRFQNIVRFKVDSWNLSDDGYSRFYFSNVGRTFFGSGNGYEWRSAADTTLAVITDAGNVGIGTTSPGDKLTILGSSTTTFQGGGIYNSHAYGNADKAESRLNLGKLEGATYQTMGAIGAFPSDNTSSDSGVLAFYTRISQSVTEKMRITNAGNVGIGTTNPAYKLDIQSGTMAASFTSGAGGFSSIRFLSTSGGAVGSLTTFQNKIYIGSENAGGTGSNAEILIEPNVGNILYLKQGGNVGIGTTNPGAKLDIVSTGAGSEGLRVDGANGGFAFVVKAGSDYTSHIRAGATVGVNYFTTPPSNGLIVEGNVGIGTTSPSGKLNVAAAGGDGSAILRISGTASDLFNWASSTMYPNLTSGETVIHQIGKAESQYNSGHYGYRHAGDNSSSNMLTMGMFQNDYLVNILGNGNVGIGTTTPAEKLHVVGNILIPNGNTIRFQNDATEIGRGIKGKGANDLVVNYYDKLFFRDEQDASDYMSIINGNVGIGTTSPTHNLHIYGTGDRLIKIENTGTYLMYAGLISNEGYIGSTNATPLGFYTNNVNRLYINTSGNVGIGTTSPSYKLDVSGALRATGTVYSDNGSLAGALNLGQVVSIGSSFGSYANLIFTMHNGGGFSDIMKLQGNGNVGIGTNSPSRLLHVLAATGIDAYARIEGGLGGYGGYLELMSNSVGSSTDSAGRLDFYMSSSNRIATIDAQRTAAGANYGTLILSTANNATTPTERMRITSGGNVGIGTTAPDSALEVNGRVSIRGGNELYFGQSTSGIGSWTTRMYASGSTHKFNASTFIFNNEGYGGAEYMRITSGGNIGVNTTTPYAGTGVTSVTINASAYPILAFQNNGSRTGELIGYYNHLALNTPGFIVLNPGDTEAVRITSGGNVGIGTTSPGDYKLSVNGGQFGTLLRGGDLGTGSDVVRMIKSDGSVAMLVRGDGNVGIGTTSPGYKLSVAASGNSYNVSPHSAGVDLYSTGNIAPHYQTNYWWFTGVPGAGTFRMGLDASGNLGIGTITPATKLDVSGVITATGGNSTNWNTAFGWGNHASAGYLTSLPSHNHDDRYYTESESDAKYLIGTTNPGSVGNFTLSIGNNGSYSYVQSHASQPLRLNPVGNAVFVDSTLTVSGAVTGSNLSISNWNTAYSWGNHASAGYATQSYVNTAVSNLVDAAPGTLDTLNELAAALGDDPNFATTVTNSIATKLPLAGGTMTGNLQVNAKVGTLDNQGIYLRGIADATHKIYYRTSDGGNVWEYNSPIKFEYYNSGIPLTRLTLDIAGNLTIGGFLTESSSIKLKENVKTSEGNLEKVVNLRPVSYNKIGSQTKELGLIAEEVAEVYPEFVQYDENGEPIGVNYSRLTAALIGAVKELTKRIETLENNG